MYKNFSSILIGLSILLLTGPTARAGVIDPGLELAMAAGEAEAPIPVIVTLSEQVELQQFNHKNKALRRKALVKALQGKATATQAHLLAFLKSRGVKEIKPFWIFNGLAAKAPAEVIHELAARPEVASLKLDATLQAPTVTTTATSTPEWNLSTIHAPELWASGIDGTGVVVAGMDTGVDANHADLAGRWRGGDNSWYDPKANTLPLMTKPVTEPASWV